MMPIEILEVSNDLLKMDVDPDFYPSSKSFIVREMHYHNIPLRFVAKY